MTIPEIVKEHVRRIFRDCNQKVSNKLSKYPATWETSLDFTFIEHLSNYSAPIKLQGNWIVRFDAHYLGGMRHWHNWEIADIGILIIFRQNGKTVKSKIALLQSKRLYANELSLSEDNEENYIHGFGRLFESDSHFQRIITPRILHFDETSKYVAIKSKDEQWNAIENYQKETTIPVHYLFYNPCQIPHSIEMPLTANVDYIDVGVGARIVPAALLSEIFDSEPINFSPRFGDLKFSLDAPFNEPPNEGGWRLENFIADELITCREGYVVKDSDDENLFNLFNRRSGPIATAFSITFDMGEE